MLKANAYSGSDYTSNTELATKLDKVFNGTANLFSKKDLKGGSDNLKVGGFINIYGTYYWNKNNNSGGTCYAYAQGVYEYLFGDIIYHGAGPYKNSSIVLTKQKAPSYADLLNKGVACGAYVRTTPNSNLTDNFETGHSYIILTYNKDNITILDANSDWKGSIIIKTWNWDEFYSKNCYANITHIVQPNITKGKLCEHNNNDYKQKYVCSKCSAVNPSKITEMSPTTYIVVSDTAKSRVAPYQTYKEVNKYAKDTVVTVTGKMTNAEKNLWYRLSDGSWIYSEHIKQYSVTYTDIPDGIYRIKNVATGKYLIVDAGNGSNGYNVSVWPLVATATEQKWKLLEDSLGFKIHTELSSGRVLNSYGTTVKAGNNVNIWDFYGNDATQRWKFQKVNGGYVIRNVSVNSCVLSVGNGDDNVSVQTFASGDKKQIWLIESVSECSHTYNSGKITKAATCTNAGVKTFTCTKCGATKTEAISATGHNYGNWTVSKAATCIATGTEKRSCSGCGNAETRNIAKTNHKYKSKVVTPTCIDYEKVQYTCEICNHTYYENSNDKYSSWSTTKPTGVDEALIESKTQYRYSNYEQITSYEASLSGYAKISSSWKKTNTGSVKYVKSWPSGFSTSHRLYSDYNKSAKSNYENTTNKLVVTDDQISGYLYFHWCRGTYEYGPRNRKSTPEYTSECNAFHAFFSTTSPNSLTAAGDGSYSYSNGDCCKDSYWYYYIPVYTQTYSEYKNLFTYERWTNWSDWSDTVYSSNSTRKVETRTVYRYSTNQLGSHSYNNGVVTKNATCTDAGIRTYTCTVCKHTYTENIAKLGHSYSSSFTVDKSATCTAEGVKSKHCTRNGCTAKTEVTAINKTAHAYSSSVTKEASCTDAGIRTYTCTVCKHSYTESITKTDHSLATMTNSTDELCIKKMGNNISRCIKCGYISKAENVDYTHIWEDKGLMADPYGEKFKRYTCIDCGYNYDSALDNNGNPIRKRPEGSFYKAPNTDTVMIGDIDIDGKITATDARLALRSAVGLEKLSEREIYIADVDKNGSVTSADARLILRASVGLEKLQK